MDDDEITVLVKRLARPHKSGGVVIERAAILAAGAEFAAIIDWITAHDGAPEVSGAVATHAGLHGPRLTAGEGGHGRPPSRFVLPASAFEPGSA